MSRLRGLLDRVKSMVVTEWCEYGVPPQLLEGLAAHFAEEVVIALELSRLLGCDAGRAILALAARELGYGQGGSQGGGVEVSVAELAHELALALQAKRYVRMGFGAEEAVRTHAEAAARAASRLASEEVARLVHELLTS